ncbi:unnamed protein product [Camellia sinensis]
MSNLVSRNIDEVYGGDSIGLMGSCGVYVKHLSVMLRYFQVAEILKDRPSNVPPAILLRFLREHRSEWADNSIDAYSAAAVKVGPCSLPGSRVGSFSGQVILPLAHTIEHEELLEVIKLEGVGHCPEDAIMPRDMFLLQQSSGDRGNSSVHGMNSIESECKATNVIHLANKSIDTKNLREMVVLAIHTGRIYSVLHAVDNTSAESPFDGNSDAIPSSYSSFAEYFSKKYGITLMHPGQPLLLLKQSHNAHNLLVDFRNEDEREDSLEEALSDMSHWVSGFEEETSATGHEGLDQSSEGWLADCFNNDEMHCSPDDLIGSHLYPQNPVLRLGSQLNFSVEVKLQII